MSTDTDKWPHTRFDVEEVVEPLHGRYLLI